MIICVFITIFSQRNDDEFCSKDFLLVTFFMQIYNSATFKRITRFARNVSKWLWDNKNQLTPRASLKSMAAWTGSRQASDARWGIAGVPRDNLRAVGSNEPLLCAPETSGLYIVDWCRNKKTIYIVDRCRNKKNGKIHRWRIEVISRFFLFLSFWSWLSRSLTYGSPRRCFTYNMIYIIFVNYIIYNIC